MLGLLFIYFIGKSFYTLAKESNQSAWGFAILGVASYYIGQFVSILLAGVIGLYYGYNIFEDWSEIMLGLAGVPFGLLLVYSLFRLLKEKWKPETIEDDGFA